MDTFLTIIIPAYNEEPNIKDTLEDVAGYLQKRDITCEVIVIDDGSKDRTVEEAGKLSALFNDFRVMRSVPNRGKGFVVRKAMMEAKGGYCLFMDADNATSIYEFDNFKKALSEGYDVVIASRRLKDSEVLVGESFMRVFMGNTYIVLSRLILGASVSDFNCGFKVFTREAARKIFSNQKMNDWSFDTEVIFLTRRFGYKLKELPVKWTHKDTSKVKPLQAGINSFISLIKIKLNSLKGMYE